ncbi:MAG: PadR family transcriptional regulator [Brevefilum sp.]|nr:PadR family transcriptional regulator [Brevefilum sp.]
MNRPVPDEVILGLLKAQPTHGYQLLEYFRSPSELGRIWTMSASQLYAVLKRLSSNGDIVGKELEVRNAPSRVAYTVTASGAQKLDAWLYDAQPSTSIHRIRVLFLSRVFIANLLDMPLEKIVSAQMAACQAQQEIMIAQKQSSQSEIEQLTLDFVIGQLKAANRWLKESNFNILIKGTRAETQFKKASPRSNQFDQISIRQEKS